MSLHWLTRLGSGLLLFLAMVQVGYGQTRVYATGVATGGRDVTNASNAVSPDGVTMPTATPRARISVSGGLSPGSENISLIFPSIIPANAAVYVRVANVVSANSITVQAYNGGSSVASSSTLLTMADNSVYYRVIPSSITDRIRITATGSPLSGTALDIHYAFYDPVGPECATVLGTTTNITGVALGSVTNAGNAIDHNLTTYSTFSVALGLLATLHQHVYFSNLSNPGEAATVTFSVPSSILSLSLLSNVTVSAYNGDTFVSSSGLNSLLSVDLLGLLNGGNRYTVSYIPNGAFDRIVVSMSNTVGLLGTLRVHEIERTPAKPLVPVPYPDVIEVCDGDVASITATSPSAGSILRWYNAVNDGTLLKESTGEVDTYTTPPLNFVSISDTIFLYVASSWKTGCPAESERAKIAIVIRERPIPPDVSNSSSCINQPVTLSVNSPVGGITYRWYTVASEGTPIFTGNDYLVSNSVTTTTYYVESYDANTGCASTTRATVTLTVHPLPELSLSSDAMTCEGDSPVRFPYTMTNGGDEYQLTWDDGTPASFADISVWTALPGDEISVAIPLTAPMGTYTGKIAIRNSVTGCEGEMESFSIQVLPKPGRPHLTISDVIN